LRDLKKLQISFQVERATVRLSQIQANHTLTLLGKMRCACPITAAMDLSLAQTDFRSASFYAMLDKLGG
jgi:hypothetical protein